MSRVFASLCLPCRFNSRCDLPCAAFPCHSVIYHLGLCLCGRLSSVLCDQSCRFPYRRTRGVSDKGLVDNGSGGGGRPCGRICNMRAWGMKRIIPAMSAWFPFSERPPKGDAREQVIHAMYALLAVGCVLLECIPARSLSNDGRHGRQSPELGEFWYLSRP